MVWKPRNPVRIGLPHSEPFVQKCFSNLFRGQTLRVDEIPLPRNCLKPGIDVELAREICHLKKLECHVSLLEHEDWGGNSTGEWTGFMRQLLDEVYDTGSMSFNPTAARLAVADFSESVLTTRVYVATRFAQAKKFKLQSVFAFDGQVWFLIFFIRGRNRNHNPKAICKGLCCVVLTGTYSAFILVSALAKDVPRPFNDLETFVNCLEESRCKLQFTSKGASHYDRIINSDSSLMLRMKESFDWNPPIFGFAAAAGFPIVLSDKSVYLSRYTSDIGLAAAVRISPDCQLDGVSVGSDWSRVDFTCSLQDSQYFRGSPLLDIYNDGLRRLRQAGILSKLHKEYIGNTILDMHICYKTTVAYKAMSFWNYVGLFVAFAGGIALAVLAIGIEFHLRGIGRGQSAFDVQVPNAKE